MTKEESIKRLESIKETYETFAYGLDDIHLDVEALEYAIGYLKGKPMTNKEKIFEVFGAKLEPDCICTSDAVEDGCIENGDCFRCGKWLYSEFKERRNDIYAEKKNNCE